MRIVLLGAPGSGKGMLVQPLVSSYGLHALSTGAMLRRTAKEGTELGRQVDALLRQGGLVSDELMAQVLRDFLQSLGKGSGYILDGYPRTLEQAELLESLSRPDCVLLLQVEGELLIDRALGRLMCSHCLRSYHSKFLPPKREMICDVCDHALSRRNDDTREVVLERLRRYRLTTEPLIEFYRGRGRLETLWGEGTPGEVWKLAQAALQRRISGLPIVD